MTTGQYWTACQTMPGREHLIRAEIEKSDRAAFVPTLARTWVTSGKISSSEVPAVPGYVFFLTHADEWADVREIEGVQRILVDEKNFNAKRVVDADMARLVLQHATGELNRTEVRVATIRQRVRRRKPRPGNRLRKITIGNRTNRNEVHVST